MSENSFNRPFILTNKNPSALLVELYPNFTMVEPKFAEHTVSAAKQFYTRKAPQDDNSQEDSVVVECGVHRGGMSILLARLFLDKHIYLFDSFQGFEPIGKSPFSTLPLAKETEGVFKNAERHYPGKIWNVRGKQLTDAFSQENVVGNLGVFDLIPQNHGITLVPGFVGDTLPKFLEQSKKIACLRIDVDAYAATYECLHYLYDSVVEGGVIIFDDFTVGEANMAIQKFFKERNIPLSVVPKPETGCYVVKNTQGG